MLLEVKNLSAEVKNPGEEEPRGVLSGVNFHVDAGETVVLLGPNGSGKSSVASSVMGVPKFKVTSGEILFENENFVCKNHEILMDARAKKGVFLSYQNPVEIQGLSTSEMLYEAVLAKNEYRLEKGGKTAERGSKMREKGDFDAGSTRLRIAEETKKLGTEIWFAERELNVGLSGGEKKKNEILQMLILRPKLAILDEIDSGLDVDSSDVISEVVSDYQKESGCGLLVITHNLKVLSKLKVDRVYVMREGKIVMEGDSKLISMVEKMGFAKLFEMAGYNGGDRGGKNG